MTDLSKIIIGGWAEPLINILNRRDNQMADLAWEFGLISKCMAAIAFKGLFYRVSSVCLFGIQSIPVYFGTVMMP